VTVTVLLEQLRQRDIRVWDDGDRLRVNAPAGALTPELQHELTARRAELLALLRQQADASQELAMRRIDRRSALPLSFAQERMWTLHQIEPASAAYHIVHADRLRGALDVRALQDAWRTVVQRHELLRARVPATDGTPEIVVDQPFERLWSFVDLSIEGARAESVLTDLLDNQAHEPFDFQTGPLSRLTLVRLAANEHVLILRLHHIVADQWSVALIRRELGVLYDTEGNPDRVTLPPTDLHFVDYAAWQRESLNGSRWDRLLAHWRDRLEGVEPVTLPSLQPRSRRLMFDGEQVSVPLPVGLLDQVDTLARQSGATPFMVMMAAFATLLYRYTGRDDLPIGTPIAGRSRVELERIVGVFINTLVLRVQVQPEQNFASLLSDVQQVTFDATAHHEMPFERLVAALAPTRTEGQMPLAPVMFNLLNTPAATLQLAELDTESIDVPKRASAVDLTLTVDTHKHSLTVEFRRDIITAAGAYQFLAHYLRTLEAVANDPRVPIANIPLLNPAEVEWLDAINQTARAFDTDTGIETLVARQAAISGGRVAITCGDESLTYAELEDRVTRLAAALRRLGVGPDVLVGICLQRSQHVPVALLAVLKAGGAYVPLDAELPRARLHRIIHDSHLRLALVDRHTAAQLETLGGLELIRVENLNPDSSATVASTKAPTGDDLAYVLYTSGSTGEPKGVEIPRRALSNLLLAMQERPGIDAEAVMVATTTFSFDIAALELLLPLTVGARVAIARREEAADGAALLALLQRTQATILQATPTTWRMLLEAGWDGSPAITVFCGGEALSTNLARGLTSRSHHVWNLYGPTETTIWSTAERITPDTDVIGIGQPLANTSVYVLDARHQRVPVGVPGELYIGGLGVARGYLGRPDLSAERFFADPFSARPGARLYRTGDLVRVRPEGRLEFLGRLDTQVKLRGYRIELSEIELALAEHQDVNQAVATIREVGNDSTLVAYLVRRKGARLRDDELRSFLRERLPAYMVPAFFTVVDALPTTPNGKLDRKALPPPTPLAAPEDTTPRSKTEVALAEMWSVLLKKPHVHVGHDFFTLGGHSLLAMKLVALVQKRFGVSLPPGMLFEQPTLGGLAARIDEMLREPHKSRRIQHGLVKMASGGDATSLVWLHGIGGEVFTYMALARHLGKRRPVYGIAADWSTGPQGQPLTVETMAERYVAELRAVQPMGPYHLGGFCGAAMIALEMARQLERTGQRVGIIIALDYPLAPLDAFPTGLARWRAGLRNARKWLTQDAMKSSGGDLLGRLSSHVRRVARYLRGPSRRQIDIRDHLGMWRFPDHQVPMLELHHDVLNAYRPRPFHGRVALFLPDAMPLLGPWPQHERHGWDDLAEGGVSTHVVRGSHGTMLLDPYARELAAAIEEVLMRTEQRRPMFTRSA
jgi:amino acid adenylation domain-containing protein